MALTPKLPPGRSNRKALAFSADIHRLRVAGYTCSAIRLALLDAGLSVSLTTIKRELARKHITAVLAPLAATTAPTAALTPTAATAIAAAALAPRPATPSWNPIPDGLSDLPPVPRRSHGHDIAEAFFKAHHSNPLLSSKERS